jgi:hypothetical protein
MPETSSSHNEYLGEGFYMRIQHCEYRYPDGTVCDVYLGVAYPGVYCANHRSGAKGL